MEAIPVTVTLTTAVEDEGVTVTRYDGLLRYTREGVRLSYTEEDGGVRTSTLLSLSHDTVSLTRRGGVDFSTVYKAGATHRSLYSSGGLRLDATVTTEELTLLSGLSLPAFTCTYTLTLGGVARRFILSMQLAKREGTV